MRAALAALVAALGFFTRVPLPAGVVLDEEAVRNAPAFAPLVGWLVGLAYLQRITGLYVLLPVAIYIMYRRRWRAGYFLIGLGIALSLVGEMFYFSAKGSSPFARFEAFLFELLDWHAMCPGVS